MTVKVIIPVYGFTEILSKLVDFYTKYLGEAIIVLVNDNVLDDLSLFRERGAIVFNSMIHGDLRHTYSHYNNITDVTDIVITNEHDVMPNMDSLYAAIHVYNKMKNAIKLASVSCMYRWNGELCYPTHQNWSTGKTIDGCGEVGRVALVGDAGVPFGFTLWNSHALRLINNSALPSLWKLDSKFGELLHSQGYEHLRLVDYSVEHVNGGVRSWKNQTTE